MVFDYLLGALLLAGPFAYGICALVRSSPRHSHRRRLLRRRPSGA